MPGFSLPKNGAPSVDTKGHTLYYRFFLSSGREAVPPNLPEPAPFHPEEPQRTVL
jgi:hypothetical protein